MKPCWKRTSTVRGKKINSFQKSIVGMSKVQGRLSYSSRFISSLRSILVRSVNHLNNNHWNSKWRRERRHYWHIWTGLGDWPITDDYSLQWPCDGDLLGKIGKFRVKTTPNSSIVTNHNIFNFVHVFHCDIM